MLQRQDRGARHCFDHAVRSPHHCRRDAAVHNTIHTTALLRLRQTARTTDRWPAACVIGRTPSEWRCERRRLIVSSATAMPPEIRALSQRGRRQSDGCRDDHGNFHRKCAETRDAARDASPRRLISLHRCGLPFALRAVGPRARLSASEGSRRSPMCLNTSPSGPLAYRSGRPALLTLGSVSSLLAVSERSFSALTYLLSMS